MKDAFVWFAVALNLAIMAFYSWKTSIFFRRRRKFGHIGQVLLQDFRKKDIKSIHVYASIYHNYKALGRITIMQGDIESEVTFKGESFDHVIVQIKSFLNPVITETEISKKDY